MNFATYASRLEAVRTAQRCAAFLAGLFLAVWLTGCGDQVQGPTPQQLAAFQEAAAAPPTVDMDSIQRARLYTGPYRVVPGDVLEFTMPALLQMVSAAEVKAAQTQAKDDRPYICRVSPEGTITLPAVGEMEVAGQALAEIEEAVVNAYRRYVVLRPSVFVRVLEYKTCRVSITGAVEKPGVYALRSDQLFLATLLMEAGGIVKEGAATIRIGRLRQGESQRYGSPVSFGARYSGPTVTRPPGVPMGTVVSSVQTGGDRAGKAVFQREGPLATTGWLSLEDDQGVLLRQWLDVGNEPQRKAFVHAVTVRSPRVVAENLHGILVQLVVYLESCAGRPATGSGTLPPDWTVMKENQLVARLELPRRNSAPDSPRPMAQTPGAVDEGEGETTSLVLPVRGFNIPFRDVALQEGDTVVVEQMQIPLFCVLGLVGRPGNFPYPPGAEYTVAQAIGFAGGLDAVADPRYVTIYRLSKDGSIARVPLQLVDDDKFTNVLGTPIRPGDVIAVERTPRTRMNTVINSLVRVNTGVYITGRDLRNHD